LTPTTLWNEYYDNEKYNWILSPSTPDIQLITDISRDDAVKSIHNYKVESKQDFELFVEKLMIIYS
jgi:hypothetical protein